MSGSNQQGTALITGASSGIGATYADRLARRGYDLILVARNETRLSQLADRLRDETGVRVEIIGADLTHRRDLDNVERRLRNDEQISLLVNNAGAAVPSSFVGADVERLDNLIQLNIVAVMRLASAVLPGFVARQRGTLINLGSVTALLPEQFGGVYSGTKAFVLNLTQALQTEVGGQGIRVQAVLPGATATEIWERSGIGLDYLPPEVIMSVDDMVDAALAGLDQGEVITLPSLPDPQLWDGFVEARFALSPYLSLNTPALRYGVGETTNANS